MSYTLRGRLESRLAALLPVVVAACSLALFEHRWWPVEAVGLMLGIGVALDLQVYHRLLPYQPGWAALPLGVLEFAALLGVMRLAGIAAPLWQAAALFAGGWLAAQLLGHAGFPLLRIGYAEEGGELGRLGLVAALAVGAALAGAGATAYAELPPVVHLAAGVHAGPMVITRRETLVGAPGAVVRGGIVVRANGVTIKNISRARRSRVSRSRARSSTASMCETRRFASTAARSTCSTTRTDKESTSRSPWATARA